jgi:hypothetical protein
MSPSAQTATYMAKWRHIPETASLFSLMSPPHVASDIRANFIKYKKREMGVAISFFIKIKGGVATWRHGADGAFRGVRHWRHVPEAASDGGCGIYCAKVGCVV